MTTDSTKTSVARGSSKSWQRLEAILESEVTGKVAREIARCVAMIVRDETSAADASCAQATRLMMQGEALRDQMKLNAILGGAFDHLTRPPGALPIRRVVATPQKIDAVAVAIGNAVGKASEAPLVELLREIAPDSTVLVRLDTLERAYAEDVEQGYNP